MPVGVSGGSAEQGCTQTPGKTGLAVFCWLEARPRSDPHFREGATRGVSARRPGSGLGGRP